MIAVTVRFTMHILSMVAVCSSRNILHTRYSLLEIGRFLILLRVHHSIGHPSIELFQGVITHDFVFDAALCSSIQRERSHEGGKK